MLSLLLISGIEHNNNIIDENGNVLFFQLQFGTYLPTFWPNALAVLILEYLAGTSEDKFQTEVVRREHYHFQ